MARESWSSATAFILVSVGSAVGIGNIWRFPYIMGVNGGGAFLVPYLIAIFVVGLSLMMVEFSIGRHYGKSVVDSFAAIDRRLRHAALFMVFVIVMILSYYWVIMGWVFAYFTFYLAGSPLVFTDFTSTLLPIPFFIIAAVLTLGVVSLGVKKGLERLSKYLVPLLIAIMVLLTIYGLSMPGAGQGLEYYLQPNFARLGDPSVWTAAFGQAFFSLSVGTGILLTYGSYSKSESITKSSAVITISDLAISLLAGLMIFPIVFAFGLDPAAGVQLAFVTLPSVFGQISFGYLLGAAFFVLLFFAAFTSSVSMLEVPVATLIDTYGWGRRKAALMCTALISAIGMPAALSYSMFSLSFLGLPVLDIYDTAFGTIAIIVAGLALTLVGGWFLDKSVLIKEIGGGSAAQAALRYIVRYAIPLVLAVTLITRILLLF
jgi:NSS family neurotransmitter:Na+ symporter